MTMQNVVISAFFATALLAGQAALANDAPPPWAYPIDPPDEKLAPDDGRSTEHVPHSDVAFTAAQLKDHFFAPDWHPDDHPPMPAIITQGRKPAALPCGLCHRADGSGGPENAKIAGLPAAYMLQQMADFISGARKSSLPERVPPKYMINTAKAINNQELAASIAYFASVKPRAAINVIESETAPKTTVRVGRLAVAEPGMEPIGQRIIEVPENEEDFELRDGRANFVAYVPPGSIQKGQMLATACGMCHGTDLKGLGPIPGIAGRSPSYVVRQLYDFQNGARAGQWSGLMKPVVQKLSLDDMIVLAAYAASLSP
jgi:cytochrome c553